MSKSTVPYKEFKKLNYMGQVAETRHRFESYTHHPINVEGQVVIPTSYKRTTVDVKYYNVHVDQKPLLSGKAREQLSLISRINSTNVLDQFPALKTMGTLPGTYSLKINPMVPLSFTLPEDSLWHLQKRSRLNWHRWRKMDTS